MRRKSFKWNTILASTVLSTLAGAPLLAAITPADAAPTPARPGRACPDSTASTIQLARIDKTNDRDFQCLGVDLEGGAVTALRLETHRFTSAGQQSAQEQIKIEDFSRSVIESNRGAVLDGIPGHDAIVLRGRFATPSGQAALVASYLYNGFTGEYHSCQITLDDAPVTGWRLVNRFDQTVSHIVVRTRQIPVIGMFGIANLDGACG